jgi:hypothetical protein
MACGCCEGVNLARMFYSLGQILNDLILYILEGVSISADREIHFWCVWFVELPHASRGDAS